MSEVTVKREQLARLQLTRRPSRSFDPFGLDTIVLSADRNVHLVAAADDFETAILHGGGVDGEEDGEVFYLPNVRVGGWVDVGREAAAAGELVIDLFFEEEHGFTGEAVEDAEDAWAPE